MARTPAVPDTSPHAPLVLPTWQVCTEDEMQEALAIRQSHRTQADAYYSNRQCCDEDIPSIADVTSGDDYLGIAQYCIVHRLTVDTSKATHTAFNTKVVDNLRHVLQQAGVPSDFCTPWGVDNGITIDEEWLQRYNTQLAITRDCHSAWPPNDGLIVKILKPIVCGATCITDDQGVPVIFGQTQRILGLDVSSGGHPKAFLLQWLPNPVAIEKILNAYKWPNLAVVRGVSQGFEDHAITTTALYAVQDYLKQIGCSEEHFLILYGTVWYEDPGAQKAAPTAAALTAAEGHSRKLANLRQRHGTRVPELVLRVVFLSTDPGCARGCDDAVYKDIRRQFHDLDVNQGPFVL
jgi:hypothetical protein